MAGTQINSVMDKPIGISNYLSEEPQFETNYIIKLQNLVGKILSQLTRISEKDRVQIDALKVKYQKLTKEAADCTRSLGKQGLASSLVSLAFSAAFQFKGNEIQVRRDRIAFQEIGKLFAQQSLPKIGELLGSGTQVSKYEAESSSNLVLQEYSAKTQKGGSDANTKQEVIGILDKALETLKRAAQS